MKTIRWLGVAIFTSVAAVAAILMIGQPGEAAPGDPIVAVGVSERLLTTPQRTCYVNWIQSVLPNAQVANLVRLDCSTSNSITQCSITDRRTFTAAQFVLAEAEGRLPNLPDPADISADGSTVTMTRQSDERALSPEQATSLDACNIAVFGTSSLASFYLRREAPNTFGAAVEVRAVTPAERLLQIRSGTTATRLGTVTGQ